MDRRFYHTSQFARIASVSARTLRYYDKQGLLSPSQHSESGYRLYTDEDLIKLQFILALKFLGFSLEEIKVCLQTGPRQLREMLAQQKAMMREKRVKLNTIIRSIEETEKLVASDQNDYHSIIKMIQVIQMELKPDWVNKYLSPEQRKTMRELARKSFSEEALQKLVARGWSEEDEKSFHQQYGNFRAELTRLAAKGSDPAGPEAQELAKFLTDLNDRRSGGDRDILAGMKKSWENFIALPDEKKPPIYNLSDEERQFIKKACTVLHRGKDSRQG